MVTRSALSLLAQQVIGTAETAGQDITCRPVAIRLAGSARKIDTCADVCADGWTARTWRQQLGQALRDLEGAAYAAAKADWPQADVSAEYAGWALLRAAHLALDASEHHAARLAVAASQSCLRTSMEARHAGRTVSTS